MKMRLAFLSLFVCLVTIVSAQTDASWSVTGKVLDEADDSELIGATVLMINIKDSTRTRYSITDIDGKFKIKNLEQAFYRIQISNLGFKSFTKVFRLTMDGVDLGNFKLEPDVEVLGEVEVSGEVIPMEQIGDTTQYNADAFKTNPDASASDLVSKMPGIVVDSDGVTANGETIEQVLLDGKRFFGQDPLLSLKTIPAEMVDKIQVYDEQSEQSKLTGFDDGNTTKTMNVVTKEDKRNGQFGKAYAGYGSDDRYKIGANLNAFNKERRMTLIGMSNNINQQNFSNEDIAGVSSGRGGFRGGNSGNFFTANQSGIATTNSVGINFSDEWGKKISFEGSYFYNQSSTINDQQSSRESFLTDGSQFYDQTQDSETDNANHRLNTRIKYDINDNNNLMLMSAISFQDNESNQYTLGETKGNDGELISATENNYSSINNAYNIDNNLIYQHKFKKIGRTFSLDLSSRFTPTDRKNHFEDLVTDSLTEYLTDENNYTLGGNITYTEPVGTSAQLSASYQLNYSNRSSDKQTYISSEESTVKSFSESLSNKFESGYTTHIPTLRYSDRRFGQFIDASISYQRAILDNQQFLPDENQFNKSFNSFLPTLMTRIEFSENSDMFIRYSTSTSAPSVSQLQEVLDNSNPLFVSIGNSSLAQSYSHSFMIRFHKANVEKNTSFSNFSRIETTNNYITTQTQILRADSTTNDGVVLQKGAQIASPINLNGYWNIQNNSSYGILISAIKSNLNTSLGMSYRRQPGVTNGIRNVSNTFSANARMALVSNISEKIDYNIYYQISGNKVYNVIQSVSNSQYYTQTIGGKLNLMFGKGFVFRNDIYYINYSGVNNSYDTQYTLWNMSLAKKFLKNDRGELELSVFDLLGENQSLSQNVNATYLEETRTAVLTRYVMMTFTYQLRRFKANS